MEKKGRFSYLYWMVFLFIGSSCEKPPLVDNGISITIENESANPIYYYIPHLEVQYPDTFLPVNRPELDKIDPQSHFSPFLRSPDSKFYFEHLPADTLSVYIFPANVYEDVEWDSVQVEPTLYRRYDLSLSDLQQSDNTVVYP